MSENYLTQTQNAVWTPEIIANESLGALGAYLNLGRTVAKDSDFTTSKVGNTVNVPKRGTIVANQKAQGSETTVQQPAGTEVPVVLDQHWEVTVGEEDFTRSLQIGSTLPGYITDGVIALAEKIEGQLAGLSDGFSTMQAEISTKPIETMNAAREKQTLNKVPRLERRFAYLHPTFITKLLNANAFVDPKTLMGANALTEGAIGRVAGYDVFEGQLVQSGGSPSGYQNMLYLRDSMVLATRPLPSPEGLGVQVATVIDENGIALRVLRYFDPKQLATVFTIDVLFGVAELDDRLGLVMPTT